MEIKSNREFLNNTQPYACLSSYPTRHRMLGGCYSVHSGVPYTNLAVGYLKVARNTNFNLKLNAKNRPRDGSYLEKMF